MCRPVCQSRNCEVLLLTSEGKTSQHTTAKHQQKRQLCVSALETCRPPPTHIQTLQQANAHAHQAHMFQTTSSQQRENRRQSPSPDMIMQECSDGLCKQRCLGGEVRSEPARVGGTNYCFCCRILMLHTVELTTPGQKHAGTFQTRNRINRFE